MTEKIDKKNDSLFPFQTYTFRNTTELETMCPSAFDLMLNPNHEHELWIGNINGLVSPTSEYGLAIKLKGYIIAGKKLTFILPENYEAIRPDNGNIGFRKTVLDMIRLGESKGQITIYTYSIEHAEDDINKILKKDSNMTFDVAIMNPPYDGNLHLKILEKVIPIAKKVVNISPIRWLQDPLAKYKKNSDYKKFENSISKKIDDIEIINGIAATNLFKADFVSDIAIYVLSNGGYDYLNFSSNTIIDKIQKIKEKLYNKIEYKKQDGWRVRVQEMKPIPNNIDKNTIGYKTMKYFLTHSKLSWVYKDGYQNNIHWSKNTLSNGTGRKTFTNKDILPESIKFDTEIEAKNFENSTKTMFYKYIFSTMKIDSHTPFKFLPYMSDYTQPWDDKRFCAYFGITGYIDDDHAEPGSEWETILKTMEQYK